MARYFVSGAGFTTGVDRHIPLGFVFNTHLDDAPRGWQSPPDPHLLKTMDEPARKALQAAIDAKRAQSHGDAHGLPGGSGALRSGGHNDRRSRAALGGAESSPSRSRKRAPPSSRSPRAGSISCRW